MNRWIIVRSGRVRETVYRLPSRCRQCRSRDIYADIQETYAFLPGPWVVQRCHNCEDTHVHRLIRDESDPPSPVWS